MRINIKETVVVEDWNYGGELVAVHKAWASSSCTATMAFCWPHTQLPSHVCKHHKLFIPDPLVLSSSMKPTSERHRSIAYAVASQIITPRSIHLSNFF